MESNYKIKQSNVLRKLRNGEVVSCIKLNVSNVRASEIAAMQGFDCIWTDMEHVPNDWSAIETQVLVSKLYDTDIVVRVSRRGYNDYIIPLEMDATGIMVPHVMDAEDAKKVVGYTKFYPMGNRAADGGNADGKYCNIDFCKYIETMNKERFIIVQIEDEQAIDNIEKICEVENIDIVFFGPGDYSLSKGVATQFNHKIVKSARKKVVETAKKFGKYAGTVITEDNLDELVKLGYQFINIGSDVRALSQYYKQRLNSFKKAIRLNNGTETGKNL